LCWSECGTKFFLVSLFNDTIFAHSRVRLLAHSGESEFELTGAPCKHINPRAPELSPAVRTFDIYTEMSIAKSQDHFVLFGNNPTATLAQLPGLFKHVSHSTTS
ncbi:hypothetical protein L9F63_014378, partial [Diploptera punctata]